MSWSVVTAALSVTWTDATIASTATWTSVVPASTTSWTVPTGTPYALAYQFVALGDVPESNVPGVVDVVHFAPVLNDDAPIFLDEIEYLILAEESRLP